jgi:hypothetical protein
VPVFAGGERIVVMAVQGKGLASDERNIYRSALVEALGERYEVLSGDDVDRTVQEIFRKESAESVECDAEKCLQEIAIALQAELIATCTIVKRSGGYLLNFQISNVLENRVIFAKSEPCKDCDEFRIVDVLKVMASGKKAVVVKVEGGTLSITSSPYEKGAKVFVDGEVKGVVPAEIKLPSGRHTVTVKSEKSEGSEKVTIADGDSKSITVALSEKGGIPWLWIALGVAALGGAAAVAGGADETPADSGGSTSSGSTTVTW